MKFAAPLFVASVLAASTFAASIPQVESRDISQLKNDALFQRAFVEGLVGRELSDADYELVTREPGFKSFFKSAFKVGKSFLGFRRDLSDIEELDARELEELIEREPGFGKFLKKAFKIGKGFLGFRRDLDVDELDSRELAELVEREPGFGKFLKKAFKIGKGFLGFRRDLDMDELDERDFEDLEEFGAREFEDLEELEAREFEEDLLEERDPLIGLGFRLAKGAAKFAVKGASSLFGRDEFEGDLVERDLDFEEALFEREYEVDELD